MTLTRTLSALTAASALALTLGMARADTQLSAPPVVRDIDVTVDLSAIENAEAAVWWAALEPDLEAAIRAAAGEKLNDQGTDVVVEIDALRLAEGFSPATGIATAELAGTVRQTDPQDQGRSGTFDLTVNMKTALPEGADSGDAAPDNAGIYRAMVATFADQVVKGLH